MEHKNEPRAVNNPSGVLLARGSKLSVWLAKRTPRAMQIPHALGEVSAALPLRVASAGGLARRTHGSVQFLAPGMGKPPTPPLLPAWNANLIYMYIGSPTHLVQ